VRTSTATKVLSGEEARFEDRRGALVDQFAGELDALIDGAVR